MLHQSHTLDDPEHDIENPSATDDSGNHDALPDEEEEIVYRAAWFDRETIAFAASLAAHVLLIVAFAAIPVVSSLTLRPLLIESTTPEPEEATFELETDFAVSDQPMEQIGTLAESLSASALSAAPTVADLAAVVTPEVDPVMNAKFELTMNVAQTVALTKSDVVVRGIAGYGTAGTAGAVDRVTYEIVKSIEERPTLVVWLFDASVSLTRRREEVRDRFDRIYRELGLAVELKRKKERDLAEEPLLTSVISFGKDIKMMTEQPSADLPAIREAIDKIQLDDSGVEMVFTALHAAVDRYKGLRVDRGSSPARNIMLIAVTDERGDDIGALDRTVAACQRYSIPVYVLGVPAPFGREFTYVKYVDPDPKFDQTPQWAQIDQGPETFLPERVQIGYKEEFFEEPIIDSGFGPYGLARLCYETGGIFFTIHPNRTYDRDIRRANVEQFASHLRRFFDPEIMDRYRPDYVPQAEYERSISRSPLRSSLVAAAALSRTGVLEAPRTRFIKRDEAAFVSELTTAQQDAARLHPGLVMLAQTLAKGLEGRDREISPRWLASFDLSYGLANAERIRNEAYNEMLSKAKRGMNFKNPKNNTWVLKPADTISVNSRLEREATETKTVLESVVADHAGTPWAYLASLALQRPIGWEWQEEFTDLSPPPARPNPPPNNNVATPNDDEMRMLKKPLPRRPIPKL